MKMATFTALNGGSPKATEGINGTADAERVNGQSASTDQPRSAEEVSASQRERDRESWGATSRERLPFPGANTYAEQESSHKRKRSNSDSPRREHLPSPSDRVERSERAERAEQPGPHRPQSETRDRYGTPQKEPYRGYDEERRERDREYWQSQPSREERNSSYEGPYSAGPVSAQSDEPMRDSLRRAASQGDSADYDNQSPDGDDSMYAGQYTPEQRKDGVIQSDPKKRKRNFSNRTKTGCLTCRKRKKKCDEAKPECELGTGILFCLDQMAFCVGVHVVLTVLQVAIVYGVASSVPDTRRRGALGRSPKASRPRSISSRRILTMCLLAHMECLSNRNHLPTEIRP